MPFGNISAHMHVVLSASKEHSSRRIRLKLEKCSRAKPVHPMHGARGRALTVLNQSSSKRANVSIAVLKSIRLRPDTRDAALSKTKEEVLSDIKSPR